MSITVLLDLDDTLLINNIDSFKVAYFKALCKHLEPIPADLVVQMLVRGVQAMIEKDLPANTLEESFDREFYPGIGISKNELRRKIIYFYQEIFPTLKPYTQIRPMSVNLVDYCFKMGYTVAIATNPVFPRAATLHRLSWAGLESNDFPFTLVSTYENFHFAKPNPTYFTEFIGQLGWPDRPVVMIGNSFKEDVIPVSKLGIPVFWVTEVDDQLPEYRHPLSQKGHFESAQGWIKSLSGVNFETRFRSKDAILSIFKSTPAVLDTMQKGFDATGSNQNNKHSDLLELIGQKAKSDIEILEALAKESLINSMGDLQSVIETQSIVDEHNRLPAGLQQLLRARTILIASLFPFALDNWSSEIHVAHKEPTTIGKLLEELAEHDLRDLKKAHSILSSLNNFPTK